MNQIGIISMFYARPFGREHFSTFARAKKTGCDFVELLVPEPGELDPKETRKALADHGLGCVLAARVNLSRDLASGDAAAHRDGVRYLESCVEIANGLGGSGIVFKLDSTQAADLDTLLGATTGVERFTLNATFSNVSGGPDAIQAGAITAAIPEASTWAMMVLGFMGVGSWLTATGIKQRHFV